MRTAVVICGRIGSGKSTAAKFVAQEFRIKSVSFGQYLRYFSGLSAGHASRASLQDSGDLVIRSKGAPGFLHDVMRYFEVADDDSAVFDGVRHVEMLEAIKWRARTTVAVYLKLSEADRLRRARSREGSAWSLEQFLLADRHPTESGAGMLMERCDLVLDASLPVKSVQQILRDRVTSCMDLGKLPLANKDRDP